MVIGSFLPNYFPFFLKPKQNALTDKCSGQEQEEGFTAQRQGSFLDRVSPE